MPTHFKESNKRAWMDEIIYKYYGNKKSNKYKLKESYDHLSGKKSKKSFFTGHPIYA